MRLAVCALSAVLLSGCAWMPWGGAGHGGKHAMKSQYGAPHGGHYKGHQQKRHNPCQIFSPAQPIPQGCNPSQVTLAAQGPQGGFPQQPDFSGGYTSQGYGSHVAQAGQHAAHGPQKPRLKKPKFRGQLSLGLERSVAGNMFETVGNTSLIGTGSYDPTSAAITYDDGGTSRTSTGVVTGIDYPEISNGDVYRTPATISGGLEYIWSDRATLFASASYASADGELIEGVGIVGDVNTAPEFTTGPVEDVRLATLDYDFNDLRRTNLEVGGRYYFDPILGGYSQRTITPFVAASVGGAHYNETSAQVSVSQLDYQRAAQSDGAILAYDDLDPETADLIDSGWVPMGALNAGVEWQVTPKTALAFETGVRFEGGRDYANGGKGDDQVAIPFTIRGSYNF